MPVGSKRDKQHDLCWSVLDISFVGVPKQLLCLAPGKHTSMISCTRLHFGRASKIGRTTGPLPSAHNTVQSVTGWQADGRNRREGDLRL